METADGSLSNSSTSTSLDTVLIDNNNELITIPRHTSTHQNTFGPILESEETSSSNQKLHDTKKASSLKVITGDNKTSKSSLKSSKVSFEQRDRDYSSDEDSFEDKRHHFQQRKATSVDHKGILKVS